MFPLTLYQTLEDRDNPQTVEDHGPYDCSWPNTWLGDGYYFWDGHIDLAHWWGNVHRGGKYMICKADAYYDKYCWDLHGRADLREEFKNVIEELHEKKIYDANKTVMAVYVQYLKKHNFFKEEPYKSIRILGSNSVNLKKITNSPVWKLFFEKKSNSTGEYHLVEPVQLCLFKKTALSTTNYRVVYPEHHREDYESQIVI